MLLKTRVQELEKWTKKQYFMKLRLVIELLVFLNGLLCSQKYYKRINCNLPKDESQEVYLCFS